VVGGGCSSASKFQSRLTSNLECETHGPSVKPSSSMRRKDNQDVIDALLAVFPVLSRTASRLVSCNLAAGVQRDRQNCLTSSRMADNLSVSPSATIKAEHDKQRSRLFKHCPLVCSWCSKASSRRFGQPVNYWGTRVQFCPAMRRSPALQACVRIYREDIRRRIGNYYIASETR
jgi:hypothetical protein